MNKIDLYYIDLKYIRALSKADDNVMSESPQIGKASRPYIGIIVLVNNINYCIPLTSPKDKFKSMKSQIDFIKIFDESSRDENNQYKLIGILNINNMIPVADEVVKKVDLTIHANDSQKIKQSKALMQKQLRWCRDNADVIVRKSQKVYNLVTENPQQNIKLTKRSLKFKRLELVLSKYISKDRNG
jgi:protein AbiQ